MVHARRETAATDCAAGGWEGWFREMLAAVRREEPCCDVCFDELLVDRARADEAWAAGFAAGTAARRGHLSLVPGPN